MNITLELPDAVVSLLGPSPERTIYQLIKAHLAPAPAPAVGGRPVVNTERDQEIAAKAAAGATHAAIANSYGLSTVRVSQILARTRVAGRPEKNVERDREIADKAIAGATYIALGNAYGLSSIRISQIVAQGKTAAYARHADRVKATVQSIFAKPQL
jgi:Mor family transcriptional regulator